MVLGGVRNILITNEIVSPGKLRRLAGLSKQAEVMVCVDDEADLDDLDAAANSSACDSRSWSRSMSGRIAAVSSPGRRPWRRQAVAARRDLRFAGLQAYHGKAQHIYDPVPRAEVVNGRSPWCGRPSTCCDRTAWNANGCGGGTGTYPIEAASGVYNEVQSGSYIFMDADYQKVRGDGPTFESALFVLTTVISRSGGRAVCDAGLKASSLDWGCRSCRSPRDPLCRRRRRTWDVAAGRGPRLVEGRRSTLADPGALRPDRQPVRLVRRHPQRHRRGPLADLGAARTASRRPSNLLARHLRTC